MNTKEFGLLCQKRGFAKISQGHYARCCGDGIYQSIYTGLRKYIDMESPNYSSENRKSNYISIGVISMYSRWNELVFKSRHSPGEYSPADLAGQKETVFHGIEEQYIQMQDYGFDVLDSIGSQKKLLTLYFDTYNLRRRMALHNIQNVMPFLFCGEADRALADVCITYVQGEMAYQANAKETENLPPEMRTVYERDYNIRRQYLEELWHCITGRNNDELHRIMKENLVQNQQLLQEYGIPVNSGTKSLTLPDIF